MEAQPGRAQSERLVALPRALRAGLLAAVAAAGARAALIALKDGYLAEGLFEVGARSFARDLASGVALVLAPALLLAGLARLPRSRALRAAALTVALAAGFLFVGLRLPRMGWYMPVLESAAGKAALAAALASAAAAAALMLLPLCAPRARRTADVALVLVAAATGVFWLQRTARAGREPRNVLLISLDTVRRDRLGCYGYPKPTTPAIDRFAKQAIRFQNAYSPDGLTLTAHGSMLTGLYPPGHGLDEGRALRPGVRTLGENFAAAGYTTLAIVDRVDWFHPRYELDRGFEHYRQIPDRADWKVDALLESLADVGARPFFAFVHLYDAHSDWRRLPYESRAEDRERFAGWYRGDFEGCDADGVCATRYLFKIRKLGVAPEPDFVEYLTSLYDAGLCSLDRELGRLFDGLERSGLADSTIVLLTADHGEEFFEHGQPLHGQLYEEVLAVPLLLRVPGRPAAEVEELANLVDVAPTLLDLAALPGGPCDGRSLLPALEGAGLGRRNLLCADAVGLHGLRTDRWVVVEGKGGLELYDAREDPHQARDVASSVDPSVLDALKKALLDEQARARAVLRDGTHGAAVAPDAAGKEQLRALGYAE